MYDVVNRNQNLTLPAVAVDVTNIQRDVNRVFNKNNDFYSANPRRGSTSSITRFRTPVPVNLTVNLGILAGYQLDLEQIFSNFAAYFNPYIVLATQVPSEIGSEYPQEVRTKAIWSGQYSITTPDVVTYQDKFRRTADTSFTLETWIYPEALDLANPIFFIDANFYAINQKIITDSSYASLSAESFLLSSYPGSVQHMETVSLSGTPTISNLFFSVSGQTIGLNNGITFSLSTQRTLLLYGQQFSNLDYVMLSSNNTSLFPGFTSLPSTYYGTVSGAPISSYEVLNDNMMQVTIPATAATGRFDIITYNRAGWSTSYDVNGFNIEWLGA